SRYGEPVERNRVVAAQSAEPHRGRTDKVRRRTVHVERHGGTDLADVDAVVSLRAGERERHAASYAVVACARVDDQHIARIAGDCDVVVARTSLDGDRPA